MTCEIFLGQGSNLCLLHWQADSSPLSHQGSPFQCLNIHLRGMWPGFQETVCRVAYSLSFLLFFSVPLNHVSARPFQLYYWKWHHPSRFDILSPAKRSDSPSSHSAVGRIAPWSFHCLQVVDKWQTWPKYLCVIGSGDALEFLSLRKILHSEKRSHFEPGVIEFPSPPPLYCLYRVLDGKCKVTSTVLKNFKIDLDNS